MQYTRQLKAATQIIRNVLLRNPKRDDTDSLQTDYEWGHAGYKYSSISQAGPGVLRA